jgi:hypothetical protein
MHLASLNFDVLAYLINFVDPVDRLNLVLSGILKGFENVNEGIVLRNLRKNVRSKNVRAKNVRPPLKNVRPYPQKRPVKFDEGKRTF